ncbi:MAG: Bor family protein [Gemmatimonadales bacterium]
MTSHKNALLITAFFTLPACYHATIETGAMPDTNSTIEQNWASGWIYGLVPASTVSAAAKCTSGVARVETQLSFLNQVVSFLTLGIYTPMSIKVTCAAGTKTSSVTPQGADTIPFTATTATLPETLAAAAIASRSSGHAELVQIISR